ncbi:MAG: FtsX-like permease family protein [Acidimicrobiia bacterium]|nr:FtsX-like permease family protein [Acidimicrobiia bacterium]
MIGSDCRVERLLGDFDCEGNLKANLEDAPAGVGVPVALTARLAGALGVGEGDRLVFPGGQDAFVQAVLDDSRLDQVNSGYLAVGEVMGVAELFGHPDELSAIYLSSPGGDIEADVAATFGGRAEAMRPNGRSRYLVPALENLRRFLVLGGMVAAALAVFLGASVFVTAAVERRRQIATVELLGESRRRLFVGFMAEGAMLGVAGAAVALPVGVVLGRWLIGLFTANLLDGTGVHLDYQVPYRLLVGCAVLAVGLGVVAAVVPVLSVFRQSPAEMLAHNRTREYAGLAKGSWSVLFALLCAGGVGLMYGAGSGRLPEVVVYGAHVLFIAGAIGVTVLLAPRLVLRLPRPTRGRRLHLATSFVQTDLGLAPWRTGFTVAILSAGVSLLVGLNGLLVSLQATVEHRAVVLDDRLLLLGRAVGDPTEHALDPDLVAHIEGLPQVEAVSPLAETALAGKTTVFAYPAETHRSRFVLTGTGGEAAGQAAALGAGKVLLSRFAANSWGVGVGDTITLPTRAGSRQLEVAGVGDLLMGSDNGYGKVVVADIGIARDLWGIRDTSLLVATKPATHAADIAQALPARGRVHVYDRQTMTEAGQLHLRRGFSPVLGVGWMMLAIAAIGVLLMLVLTLWDRRRQRAALRQLGMSYPQELWALLADAAMLTFLAVLFGTTGGLIYGWGNTLAGPVLFSISPPFTIPWHAIAVATAIAAAVCLIGALLPIASTRRFDTLNALNDD